MASPLIKLTSLRLSLCVSLSPPTPRLVRRRMEIDGGERPVVDAEEMILYWMELWGRWDPARWELAFSPRSQLPPARERLRKPAHGKTRPPLRIKY